MNKISGMLGLCRKAGKLTMGFDMTADALEKGEAELLLIASDCSERTKRKIIEVAGKVTVRELPLTMDEISFAVSKRSGVLAVCESGFAKKIIELLDRETP